MRSKQVQELSPGDMFRRVPGGYRYIVTSSKRWDGCGCVSIYCYNLDGTSIGYWWKGNERVFLMPCPEEDIQHPTSSPFPFYMCHVEGGRAPTVEHLRSEATSEAGRLAKVTGRRVFLLRAVAYVDYTPPTQQECHWTRLGD